MNIPYQKKWDKELTLMNPIDRIYINEFPNRKQRRSKEKRFLTNRKGCSLTIAGQHGEFAYKRILQTAPIYEKGICVGFKSIHHYQLKTY